MYTYSVIVFIIEAIAAECKLVCDINSMNLTIIIWAT